MTTLGYVLIGIGIFLFIVVSFIFALGLCRMASGEWDSDLNEPYQCNMGLTDEEIAQLTKEDK